MACGGLYLPDSAASNGDLLEELNVLKEIYLDDILVKDSEEGLCCVQIQIHPATGEFINKRLVYLVLNITPLENYPNTLPRLAFSSPRGLSESYLNGLQLNLFKEAEKNYGLPMIYNLIEHVRESLTNNNVPSMECMICLEEFKEGSPDIVKTICCHYYHAGCISRYKHHIDEEEEKVENEFGVPCPVCRTKIEADFASMKSFTYFEDDPSFKYEPSDDVIRMREVMTTLFMKQKRQGGIIDLEEIRNRGIIVTRDTDHANNTTKPN